MGWADDWERDEIERADAEAQQAVQDEERRAAQEAERGWLFSIDFGAFGTGRPRLATEVMRKDTEGEKTYQLAEWSDFDVTCTGVMEEADTEDRYYLLRFHRARDGAVLDRIAKSTDITNRQRLVDLLGSVGCSFTQPPGDIHAGVAAGTRLLRYLEGQGAPRFRLVPCLGWDDKSASFITNEGVIRADGFHPFDNVRPHPILKNWAPYVYGFDYGADDMRDVLQEVLTFQERRTCAVFGAWVVATILKAHFFRVGSSLFPFMALEAPSESGKTKGFFGLFLELTGHERDAERQGTTASIRDAMSAHRGGIVWIDDHDDLKHLGELFRSVTGEGNVTKKADDKQSTVNRKLVSAVVVSGESLNMFHQKANRDRAARLDVKPATGRMSEHDPSKDQWDDVMAVKRAFPDGLRVMAGTFVQEVLKRADEVERFLEMRRPGRAGDKIGILRVGARILADLSGLDWILPEVEGWVAEQVDLPSENTLTLRVLPELLQVDGYPTVPKYEPRPGWPRTPVYVDRATKRVMFHLETVASVWERLKGGRVDLRTETLDALRAQAENAKVPARGKQVVLRQDYARVSDPKHKARYRELDEALSQRVVEAAGASWAGEES